MNAISKDSFPALLTHSASQPGGHGTPPIRRAGSSYPFFNVAFLQLDFLFLFILWSNHHFLFATTPARTRPHRVNIQKAVHFSAVGGNIDMLFAHCEWENRNRHQYFLGDTIDFGRREAQCHCLDSSLILGTNLTGFLCSQYKRSIASLKIPNPEYSKIWKFCALMGMQMKNSSLYARFNSNTNTLQYCMQNYLQAT